MLEKSYLTFSIAFEKNFKEGIVVESMFLLANSTSMFYAFSLLFFFKCIFPFFMYFFWGLNCIWGIMYLNLVNFGQSCI